MRVLMLRNMRKGLLFTMVAGLTACSQLLLPNKPLEVSLASPITVQGLPVQNLISYDLYADGPVLHAMFSTATADPKQPYIGYLSSDDDGRHWSAPIALGQYVRATIESMAGNDLQIAASGDTLLAIWQVTGEIPGMGPLAAMYSKDGGQTWVAGANPTGSEGDQSHPDLVADSDGRFHLIWLDDRDENGYQGVRYARSSDAGQHWELAQTVDESSCSCCWNRLITGPDGQLNALYRDMEPRDMALAQSMDGGKSWRRISTVGEFNWIFDGCPHNGGALIRTESQTLHALAWTGAEHKSGLYYLRSADNGKNWSLPQAMRGEALAFHGDIAAGDEGRLIAIWDAMGADGSVVVISESVDNGRNWSASRQISTVGGSAVFPRIIATRSGFLAMWSEQKPGGGKQWMSAILE